MITSEPELTVADNKISCVAVKLFFGITEEWQLSDEQRYTLVGENTPTTLLNWKKKLEAGEPIDLSKDTLERLSYLAGIYKKLQVLFADSDHQKDWIKKSNRDFGGKSALERMLGGRTLDLADVHRYLDGCCEDHYL